ncbi:uncharacterized protein LOC113060279 [Carassius auratus]|uniref:Uncharacterized protein LOC113060279 n=1 Tax=Carassius auratus TaxID=7957 RepID=A0A6P6LK42_CARAU|nr:uncharacterized protein LOC113060279 [Carassius auratus]
MWPKNSLPHTSRLDYLVQREHPICGQKQNKFNFGAWNVRTLMDSTSSDRPERQTAIIARELQRCRIDIAALSETRLAGEGQLKEEKGGYTFFWKRKPADEARNYGVGLAIKNQLVNHLSELPVGISERLMTIRLMLANNQTATVVSTYAPTLDSDVEEKEAFYACLEETLSKIHKEDKIILLGDFNARVGRDQHLWKGTVGKEGIGNINSNGVLLLSKCAQHNLIITNTLYRQKNKFKASWRHPRSKQWHLTDYVIVRARDRCDVNITRAMIDSDNCWTDHRLIRSTMSIKLKKRRRIQKKQTRRRLNLDSLNETAIQKLIQDSLEKSLQQEYPDNIEEHWGLLKFAIHDSCKSTLGYQSKKHQDWFDENDTEIEAAHSRAKFDVQKLTRELKNKWWTEKSLELQRLADSGNTRGFFSATKAVYGPSHRGLNPLRPKDGQTLLKDNDSINARLKEHFQELLNRDSSAKPDIADHIPQSPIREDMGEPPTLTEVHNAIRNLRNNKATGPDGIPVEILKEGGPRLWQHIHHLLINVWERAEFPSELRDAQIVTIFKKGDRAECGNYRGISLLSTTGKVLARVLANRLLPLSQEILAAILHLTGQELPQGIPILYRTDGRLFNLNRIKAKSKVRNATIIELQYADDNAIASHSPEDLQDILNAFAKAYRALGLVLNIKKTQVLYQPPPNQPSLQPIMKVDNTTLESVDHFPYLGSILSSKADIDCEVNHRLSCASGAYAKLRKRVFDDRDLRAQTKVLVYRAAILPTLLYGAESWTNYSRHLRALERFHQRALRKILRINWEDRCTNSSILEETNMPSITTTIMQHQLQWIGHVIRMPNNHLPKQILYSLLKERQRAPGGPKKHFKDNINTSLKKFNITSGDWENLALNRDYWRKAVKEDAAHHETELRRAADVKRQHRKDKQRKAPPPHITSTFQCPHCTRICGSQIGLYSHHKLIKNNLSTAFNCI